MNPQTLPLRRYIKLGILGLVLLITAFILSWISSHSYLDIHTNTTDGVGQDFLIVNQNTGDQQKIHSDSSHFKRLVHKGTYEVTVTESGRNAWSQVKAAGFLGNSQLNMKLQSEAGRAFVGNNPASCMYPLSNVLLSYECNSTGGVTKHVPADATTPTYTQSLPGIAADDSVVGIVKTASGNVLITKSYDLDSDTYLHTAGLLGDDFSVSNQTPLSGIDSSSDYALLAYKDGFILYTVDLKQILYFSSINAQPISIDMPAKQPTLTGVGLQASTAGLVAYYSDQEGNDSSSADQKVRSEVVVRTDTQVNNYNFDTPILSATFCGPNLCTLTDKGLDSYLLNKGDLVLDYSLSGATALQASGNSAFITTNTGIFAVSNIAKPDHYLYTFGVYRSCGLSTNTDTPVVCVISPNQDKLALSLNGTLADYPVDVSVAQLLQNRQVQAVSAYQNYIYVTPNVGSLTYDKNTNNYSYSDAQQNKAKTILKQAITGAKLDTTTYQVIDTLE